MMTKNEFANAIVARFCESERTTLDNVLKNPLPWMARSSKLAVALEHLGLLDEEELEYSDARCGVFLQDFSKVAKTITTREIIDLLPDEHNSGRKTKARCDICTLREGVERFDKLATHNPTGNVNLYMEDDELIEVKIECILELDSTGELQWPTSKGAPEK